MKRGKHVTKRFFPFKHTLSSLRYTVGVCVFVWMCWLTNILSCRFKFLFGGEWKKNMCLSASTHSNDARCAHEIRVKAYAVHAHKHTIQIHLTCVYVLLLLLLCLTDSIIFHTKLHPFRLVLNTRSSVEQPTIYIYIYINGSLSHNRAHNANRAIFCWLNETSIRYSKHFFIGRLHSTRAFLWECLVHRLITLILLTKMFELRIIDCIEFNCHPEV